MAGQFQPGDVVVLKSGGPRMTVEKYDENGEVFCHWLDEKRNQKSGSFPEVVLTKYVVSVPVVGRAVYRG